MADLKKQAETLGITVDNRWGDERLQQEIDKAKATKEAETSEASQADQKAADKAKADADTKAKEEAEKLAEAPISGADLEQANSDTLPTLGGPRVASTAEIREELIAEEMEAAPYPADPKEAHARAAALSRPRAPAPEFRTSDLVKGEKGEDLFPIRLLNDWWDGQGLRHKRGEIVELPYNEAKRLVGEKKGERADAGF